MNTISVVISILQVITGLFMTAVVLFQSGKRAGLSGAISGGAETFFGKNKGRTLDAKLSKATVYVAIIFVILTVALNILK
ncbi:MAG: preprotein translocase subunit SecG [Clostridiales bacterium]|nr:preprotein translocase subunit SecG [Clostridiales bacterium]